LANPRFPLYDASEDCGQEGVTTMKQRALKSIACGVAVLGLGAGGFALAGTTALSLTSVGPVPDTVTVPWGDTLAIQNADSVPHSLVSSHAELQSGSILPGQTFTTTLTSRAHSYGYRQTGGRGFPGKIVVDFSGRVSLRASRSSVAYGRSVTLRGTTSLDGTPVSIEVRRAGDVRWRLLRTLFSSDSGAFSTVVRFQRGGKLRATVAAGEIRSASTFVNVRPKLTAARIGGSIRARLSPARAASRLTLECRAGPGRWKRVVAKRPGSNGVVTFVIRGHRAPARVAATHNDAAGGYAPVASRALSAAC
jgi:hypothetical protein